MKCQYQFTIKQQEKRADLTNALKQQPCSVQVVEGIGLDMS